MSLLLTILGLILLAASVWYLPWRVAGLLGSKRRLWPWRILLALLMGAYLVAMHFRIFATGDRTLAGLYLAWAVVFVFEIYLFLILAVHHGLRLALGRLGKVSARPRLAMGVAALLAVLLCLYQLHRTQSFVITEHVVPVPGLEAPVRILHFVDLHLGAFRREAFLAKILAEISRLGPDIVIWNGDLASSDLALDERLFGRLKEVEAEQYYTTGNHEFDVDNKLLHALLKDSGIEFLRSRMVETHGLQLIGLEYMNGEDTDFRDHGAEMITDLTIAEVLPTIARDRSKATVLFHHGPVGFRHASMGQVDVMLTGNTHAGQKSPLISMFRLSSPYLKAGPVEVGLMTVLVSSGGGNYLSWFRLGEPYEFQLITLIPG